MTKRETNLYKKGSRCQVCTGCGRCFGEKQIHTVHDFTHFAKAEWGITDAVPQEVQAKAGYLVAVDIGTTTIAMQLREITSGKVVDVYTCINPQRAYGADVLSRIEAAGEHGVGKKMQDMVQSVLQEGLAQFAKSQTKIVGMAIAANTTMIHLLMGYETDSLGRHPFTPKTVSEIRTKLLGFDTVILPGVSAFVGADVVAGIYALSMHEREAITLLVDLGTNGEMVLGNKERLLATSTAAGPAFEGGGEYFGTDLVKLVATLLKEGVLDSTGLLAEPYFEEGIWAGGVQIAQPYIRQLQMAKSAICTGIRILCEKYGLKSADDIDRVFLAGGMGYYLDVQAAAEIGLLPKQLEKKTVAVGNAALEGAFLYGRQVFGKQMLEKNMLKNQDRQVENMPKTEEFNLAMEPAFADSYISGMELTPCIEW